ncbi:Pyridoxamine 5'-phosphate oxidase-like, FMN-binding domain [Ceraceosorus bombacis]|uniref:Pyridoxamine 5'-phosphate oxidase-like, FMN-binding domain n=2 Tax=Ceraceosorus TaxID=401624 RepID=A0A0P1B938_9BASI|nr:hypothetical protein IE81DRAFT_326238 [Ceraceosorus guamensis]PWN39718.1 hypothetical protein IE81DRAFT_326238 [Ceraceosorus guamensis]CEH11827.1 Pyridoxamine 5'-phosphate oxidase-like, FMN-binding domain [Ceraceosorus bombacis]
MATHDPTAQKASSHAQLNPSQKWDEVQKFIKEVPTSMLVSNSPDGKLASRAMNAATVEGGIFHFFTNVESGKTNDLENSPQVNVSYLNPKDGSWVSVSGTARVNTDREKIKKHWHPSLSAWFNKKDDKHDGTANDPRVGFIEVHPDEIRYFKSDGALKTAIDAAKAALTGGVAAPGSLIIITQEELKVLADHFHK